MHKHLLILHDGTELFSGPERENVLKTVTTTQNVNSGTELTLGSTCACELQAELIMPYGGISLESGDTITLYQVDEEGSRQQMGVFYLEKPVRQTAHTVQLTAYDAVSRLDKDLTLWLAELDQWPYTVAEFAQMICDQCGLDLVENEIPNAEFYIQPFSGEGVTGRHLMQWLGQIAGRFCRATVEGKLEFAWYVPNEMMEVTPAEGENSVFFYQGELEYADYQVKKVEKVQLRQSSEDVGTVWPDEAGEKNTYIIENNPMLVAQNSETLLPVAQTLYTLLQDVTYTPCRVVIPATPHIHPGDILTITDANGITLTTWVMKKTSNGQRDTLECTGSHRRDSTTAINKMDFRALSGKVLNLRTDVEGLKVENMDTKGRVASMKLDLEGIQGRVEQQENSAHAISQSLSTLTQTAQDLTLQLESVRYNGVDKVKTSLGYTFDDSGLHISRSDSDMENTLDHTGMYVKRGEDVMLQANNQGVIATDVTVRNYLIVGDHARFEDYGEGRTACFFAGGKY